MRLLSIIGLSVFTLAGCATAIEPDVKIVDIEAFSALTERTFETPASDTDNIIKDRRTRVVAEVLPGFWFYKQLNTGEGHTLYRQRLSNFTLSEDGTAIVQKTYGFENPEKYVDAWTKPDLLKALTPADFKPYFSDGCEQIWRPAENGAWLGYVDPQTCVIKSKRRGKDIRIESEGYLSFDVYRTNERGYDIDMTFLWGTKPGEMITLYPTNGT